MKLKEKAARLIELRDTDHPECTDSVLDGISEACYRRPLQETFQREDMIHVLKVLADERLNSAQIARAFIIAENGLNKILNHKAIGQVSDQDFILQLRGIVRDALKEIEAIK